MYCKIFTSRQVYDGMTEISIACDNVFVTDGWICLYKDEKFVASFDMASMNGWVLIYSETIDDYVKRKAEPQNGYQTFNGTSVYVSRLEDDPQTEREDE